MATSAAEHQVTALDDDRMHQAAEILLRARREVMPVHELPVKLRPHNIDEAYALQALVADAMGHLGGWKVGFPGGDASPVLSAMPLWGGFARSGSRIAKSFRRLRGVEAEIAFCLSKDLPAIARPYTQEEVKNAIGSAHPAIEMLESAYFEIGKADRLSFLGDMLGNGGFVYGAAAPGWEKIDLTAETVTVSVDGAVRYEGKSTNPAGHELLRLVTWLANEGSVRTGGLKFGQWITTGSWSGVTYATSGSTAEARFARFGEVRVKFD